MEPDPFALPCHDEFRIDASDRDWRSIGVKSADDVKRKQTRCPGCKTSYSAYLRTYDLPGGVDGTVEWVRPTPFRVTAAPIGSTHTCIPVWQDATEGPSSNGPLPDREASLTELQAQVGELGEAWMRSVQLVTPIATLTAQGEVFATPGDLLLERRQKWNAQDRRLALVWSPRLRRPVVLWHSFARLLQP
jgi:hypothetical protein